MLSLSIIVPVYSGERYLKELATQAEALRNEWSASAAPIQLAELIFVDDGARDGSPNLIDELAAENDWVVALHLSRNFGQHPATIAGILHSSGDWVASLDEDLQHPPLTIVDFFKCLAEKQSDIVYGRSSNAVHENGVRDFSSKASKKMVEFLSGNTDISKASSFRVIRGSIARVAASVCSHDTYFDVALTWFTQRIATVELEIKDQRFIESGKSGYNFRSLLSHGRRLLFSNYIRPLRLVGLFGMLAAGFAALLTIWVLVMKLIHPPAIEVKGWVSIVLLISFMSGVTLLMISIVLEHMSVLILRAHGKPLFFTIDRSNDKQLLDFFLNR